MRDDNVIAYDYTQAARWGSTDAGAALARLDRPVPDSDLLAEARFRADRDRENRRITHAIAAAAAPRPSAQPRPIIGTQPIGTGFHRPPMATLPTAPVRVNTNVSTSQSTRRNCVNNVCRTERTTCTNGVCRTEVLP